MSVLFDMDPPAAPSIQTIRGQPYPGDQSVVTVAQNPWGVILLGSCPSGLLSWSGSDGQHGRSNSSGNVIIIAPTTNTGVFTYTATCQLGAETSPATTATVTVVTYLPLPAPPLPPIPFTITGVTDVVCVTDGPTSRRLSFTPQYGGVTGYAVTFSVRNELAPSTAYGPYSLRLYTDNPTIHLQAEQNGTPGTATYDFNWASACTTPLPDLSIRYVKPGGSGTGDGSSWANASGDLRTMLRASTTGNQVWVAAGTYKTTPVSTSATYDDRVLSFVIPSGVQVYGGFAGTETSLDQRRLSYPLNTILSGDIGLPTTGSTFDNTYHVVTFQNVATGTLLDGFVVRDGGNNSNTQFPFPPGGYVGAGIFNTTTTGNISSPTIQNCQITKNEGAFAGGGMSNRGDGSGTATLINCLFSENYGEHAGAISSPSQSAGSGIVTNFTVNMLNCNLVNNGCSMSRKAIEGGRIHIRNSIIWGNSGPSNASVIDEIDFANSTILYSIVQGENDVSFFGPTNRHLDPQFVASGILPDYRLQVTSPAINTGDPEGTGLPPTDLAGNARVAGGRVDMGVFEYGGTPSASGLTLLAPAYDCSSGAFTFRTSGGNGSPIEYQAAPGITGWITNPNQLVDRELRTACDAGPITLRARYVGQPASEVTLAWSIRAVCPACGSSVPTPPTAFAITGVRDVSCVATGPTERRLTFTPQYSGLTGQPITFSARYESLPTTAPGPYTLRLYIDNPTVTLQAQQDGTAGMATYAYNWVGACSAGSRVGVSTETAEAGLTVRLLGNPTTDESVLVDISGADGQALHLTTTDSQGRAVGAVVVEKASSREQHWLKIGSVPGLYLLRVSTPNQSRTLKVIRR